MARSHDIPRENAAAPPGQQNEGAKLRAPCLRVPERCRQSRQSRCPFSAQNRTSFDVFVVQRRAKSLLISEPDRRVGGYEPDELPDCSTPRIDTTRLAQAMQTLLTSWSLRVLNFTIVGHFVRRTTTGKLQDFIKTRHPRRSDVEPGD